MIMSISDQIMHRLVERPWGRGGGGEEGGGALILLSKKWTLYSKLMKQLSLLLTRILFTLVCLPYWH